MPKTDNPHSSRLILRRIVICSALLAVGLATMLALASMKKPPATAQLNERPLRVDVMQVQREDVPVTITGYGEARPLNVVTIAPEVGGKIVAIHARLEPGEIIGKGDILFKIDDRDYRADLDEAAATVRQWQNTIQRLKKQYAIDRPRLETLRRSRDLARAEYQRLKELYEKDSVGTLSGVDGAERAANTAADQADLMAQTVALYPIRIKEAQNSLQAAKARREIAAARLERCVVAAPFRGRLKEVNLESGQYVSPGHAAVVLADDALLEIHVPLDSRDVRDWLRFENGSSQNQAAWFGRLKPVGCKIRWTEAPGAASWRGELHRVVKFDQQTRTLTVAVRVTAAEAVSAGPERMPLVEGMFCSVEIPGRTLTGVYRVPRWAVSFEQTVYVAENNRLKTVPVEVARIQGEETLIAAGLEPGDQVIVTRLVDPLENSLLEFSRPAS